MSVYNNIKSVQLLFSTTKYIIFSISELLLSYGGGFDKLSIFTGKQLQPALWFSAHLWTPEGSIRCQENRMLITKWFAFIQIGYKPQVKHLDLIFWICSREIAPKWLVSNFHVVFICSMKESRWWPPMSGWHRWVCTSLSMLTLSQITLKLLFPLNQAAALVSPNQTFSHI